MYERYHGTNCADLFDPYNMLPVERVVTCLGERR